MTEARKKLSTIRKYFKIQDWFVGFTSLSGISQYRISDNKHSKRFWLCMYVFGLCWTAIIVHDAVERYLGKPFVTKVSRLSKFSSKFPSVTICNPNRIHCQHLYDMIDKCAQV